MVSPTQWTWVWVNSRRWWWIGRPGMLPSMGSQRVGHDWVNRLKITVDGDCSHEIRRHLLLGRKPMTSLDRLLKCRDITLLMKVRTVKAIVFPVVMYRCESWTIKKTEWQRIDAFELWCWRRLLRVPWTARRSNQYIVKEINPKYSLEGLMMKLKLQYFGHLMWRVSSLERPWCGKDWGKEEKGATENEMTRYHYWLNRHAKPGRW